MSAIPPSPQPLGNRLLAALPHDEATELRLESISLQAGQVLYTPHRQMGSVYRVGSRPFALTQALFARAQGVRRGTINQVCRTFQQVGFISYGRGTITILDRSGLEEIVCECYGVITREYRRLLG